MLQKLHITLLLSLSLFLGLNAQNGKRLQIADEFPLSLTSTNQYFQNSETGIVYTETFSNKGSAYIKLHINSFDLAPGDFVKVYSSSSTEEYIYSEKGKIVGTNKLMISEFWTGTIWSDSITVELHVTSSNRNNYGFNIDRVAYGHSAKRINAAVERLENTNSQETICSADNKEAIVCYDGTEMGRKAKAVCRLLIGGGGLCTGWLLGCDGNVMTNNHCIGDAADANNTDFLFNYQYDNCAGTINATSDLQATSADFIQTSGALDFTLVKLPVNPTPTYGYLSLSSTVATIGERIYIPQHPGGRRKEIAVNTDVGGDANGFAMVTGIGGNGARVTYQCDTEGGSSGSPVLRFNDNLVIAIHNTGGCPNGAAGRSDEIIAAIAGNMPACGIDDNNPDAPYVSAINNIQPISEATDCSYQDIDLTIRIAKIATQNADVTLSVTGGTATANEDFELLTTSVTFVAGNDTNKTATLRVYNDAFVEGEENIVISLALNANGGDAELSNINQFNISILDNDYNAENSSYTLFSEDFENDLSAFTVIGGAGSNFAIGNAAAASSTYFDASGNDTNFIFVNDDDCNCDMSDERIMINMAFDFTDYVGASINFDYAYEDDNGTYNNDLFVQASTDNGTTWTTVGTELAVTSWDANSVDLSAYAGQSNVLLSFFYTDTTNWAYGAAIDNLTVKAIGNAEVQVATNNATAANLPLFSAGTIDAFDATNGNIMASITGTSDFDYGCTSVEVSRNGSGAQPYNGSVAPALVADKTFTITPTNTNPSGESTISFFLTEAELDGWETATGDMRANLRALKNNGSTPEEVATTITAFGDNSKVTATFTTGIDGTYYFGNIAFLSTISFNANNGLSIYPNPVTNELNIKTTKVNDVKNVSVHNMLGQVILRKTVNSVNDLKINTSNLSNGMYFLNIQTDNANQTIKFLKK